MDVIVVQNGTELILKQQQLFGTSAHDCVNLAASCYELTSNREGDSQANAAADNCPFALAHLGRLTQRTSDVLQEITNLVGRKHPGGLADYHKDKLDPTLLRIPIRKGKWNALATLICADHQELTSMCVLGHLWCLDAELEDLLGELSLFEDLIHSAVLLS